MYRSYDQFRLPDDLYVFDSMKIANHARTLKSYYAHLCFFQSLKIEFDNGSAFCQHHIDLILRNYKYVSKYLSDPVSDDSENQKISADPIDLYIRKLILNNPDRSWSYFFFSENDYMIFIENINNYFTCKDYADFVPICIKEGTLMKFCRLVHDIYFNLSPDKKLKSDLRFFTFLKHLNVFKNLGNGKIYYMLIHY